MEEVTILYQNNIGVAFHWDKYEISNSKKIQLIFRNTGLILDYYQLFLFSKQVKTIIDNPKFCENCENKNTCNSLLLNTPLTGLKFAMSLNELNEMHDLIIGVIFQLDLKSILKYFEISTKN